MLSKSKKKSIDDLSLTLKTASLSFPVKHLHFTPDVFQTLGSSEVLKRVLIAKHTESILLHSP